MNNILETSIAYWKSAVLFTALKWNLFEKLGERKLSVPEIAVLCGVETDPLQRILRALTAMKLIERGNDTYSCAPDSMDYLIPGREQNLSHFCRIMGEDFASGIWVDLSKSGLRYDASPLIIRESPVSAELFTMAMDNLSHLEEAQSLVENTDLSQSKNLLDLGCGSAAYSIAFCRNYPHLQAVCVDQPDAAAIARKIVQENELEERIIVKSARWQDTAFRQEFDTVLLSDVLYQTENNCRELIDIAKNALRPQGVLLIRGYFLSDSDDRLFPALFDVNLSRNNASQKNYHIAEIMSWLQDAGFTSIETKPLTELSYLITGSKSENK